MRTLILAMCLLGALAIQGCEIYAEPVGGYYQREGIWYYHDGGGREWHENHHYHHDEGHHDEGHHDDHH